MTKSIYLHALCVLLGVACLMTMPAFAASKPEAKEGSSKYEYVELRPILIPIVDGNGISQVINFTVALELDNISVEKVERLEPKLTDAFIMDMYGTLAMQAAEHGGLLKLSVIKERLLKVSNRILAEDSDEAVHDVLLQLLDQRRI